MNNGNTVLTYLFSMISISFLQLLAIYPCFIENLVLLKTEHPQVCMCYTEAWGRCYFNYTFNKNYMSTTILRQETTIWLLNYTSCSTISGSSNGIFKLSATDLQVNFPFIVFNPFLNALFSIKAFFTPLSASSIR